MNSFIRPETNHLYYLLVILLTAVYPFPKIPLLSIIYFLIMNKVQNKTQPAEAQVPNQRMWYLYPDQIQSYRDNGFLIVEKLFSSEECDAMLDMLLKNADKNYSALMQPHLDLPEKKDRDHVLAVIKDKRVVDVLEQIQGSEIDGLMTQILFKWPGTPYVAQAWSPHQDNSYPQAAGESFITINLALKDADKENGGVYVYNGSHKEGLLPFTPRPSFREKPGTSPGNTVLLPAKYIGKESSVYMRKGGILILHGNVVHGSYPNLTKDRPRPIFQATFLNKGVEFIPGKNARRERVSLR